MGFFPSIQAIYIVRDVSTNLTFSWSYICLKTVKKVCMLNNLAFIVFLCLVYVDL